MQSHYSSDLLPNSDGNRSQREMESRSGATLERTSLGVNLGRKSIRSAPRSADSSAISRPLDVSARRSTYSNAVPAASRRKVSVASPLGERISHRSSETNLIIPAVAKAQSLKEHWQRRIDSSSSHLLNIKTALPESITLPSKDVKWLESVRRKSARQFREGDKQTLQTDCPIKGE